MKFVLLKLSDEATEKFVKKAGTKVVGVWDKPEKYCDCPKTTQLRRGNWLTDDDTGRLFCNTCGNDHKPVTSLATRLRIAFIGRNMLRLYR